MGEQRNRTKYEAEADAKYFILFFRTVVVKCE